MYSRTRADASFHYHSPSDDRLFAKEPLLLSTYVLYSEVLAVGSGYFSCQQQVFKGWYDNLSCHVGWSKPDWLNQGLKENETINATK